MKLMILSFAFVSQPPHLFFPFSILLPHPLPLHSSLSSPTRWPSFLSPTFHPHALFHSIPNALDHLPIPPPALHAHMIVPLLNLRRRDPSPPPLHRGRHILAPPAYVDALRVLEQLGRALPLVALELPRLARGEDRHHPTPVVRFELLRRVDQDESQRSLRVDGRQQP